jgi:PAS domain S-box-containing protein
VTDAPVNHKLYKAAFRLVREDGAIRWVTGTGSFYYGKDGKPERMLGMAVDITELKHAEEGLKKSEEKFSKAFRESPLALTITSADDHRYLDINETFEQITGWRRDQVIGRTPFDIQIWVAPEERVEFVKRLRTEGSVRNYEVHFRCKDGAERIGRGSAELIEIDNESCILSVIADITETKRTEEKLSESQTRLIGVIDSAMDAIIAIDEEQRILLFNAAAEKMFGCSANDALGTSIERFIPPHLSSSHGQYVKQFGESGTTTRAMGNLGALSAVRLNGEEFPIEASISHLGVNRKKLFTAIIRDVTERRRAEEAERQSEERTHLAFQVGRMYADEWDADNDVILRSPECMSILGADQSPRTTRGELLRSVHPDDREQLASFFAGFTLEHSTNQVSYRFERPDGSVIWLEKRAQAFFDDNARLLRTIGVVADITDRKQSDLALRESEERFRLVANSAPVMIWTSGPNKMCDYFNQQWLNFTGRPLAAELGNGWAEGVHPEDLDACLNTYSQAFDKHEPFDMQYRIRRHDGQYRWIQDRGGRDSDLTVASWATSAHAMM